MMNYLNNTRTALDEVTELAPSLKKAIELGEFQGETRDGVIQTINEMSDALQLASDLIGKELSASITEFNRLRSDKEDVLRGYFERLAAKLSEPSLRLLLHEGHVCAELHKLGDRFEWLSPQAMTGLSAWEAVKVFFNRASTMSHVLHGLIEGERDYLRDFASFLDDVRNQAEVATGVPPGSEDFLRQKGDELIHLMRQKRQALNDESVKIRQAADKAILALH